MKKIYTLLCIAATMLAACAKENLVENDTTPQDEEVKYIDVSFNAEFPVPAELQDNAKTRLDEDLSVLWCKGDQIAVNNDDDKLIHVNLDLNTFTAEVNPDDPHRAIFSGKIDEKASNFFAVYPAANVELGTVAGAGANCDGNIYMFLPNTQTATKGSFANGCALSYANGKVSGGVMQNTVEFHNLCAILEFTMPDYVVGAQTVNIKSNDGKKISGGCVLNRKDFIFQSFEASDKKKTTYDNVTVTAPNTASKFYAVIFPGNYSNGFTITVTTAGGQTYSRNVTKALKADANHIYNLGTLGVVLDEQKVNLDVKIDQNIQTGSVATFNIAAKDDFKAMVKSWDINLYNSADQLVRKIEGNTTGSGTLETVGDFKLLAAGEYYATVTYFMQTGSKRAALNFTGFKAEQFQVEGVVVNATTALNYEGSTLNGTDVELSFDTSAVDPDLAKHISWGEIKLTAGDIPDGEIYRTATEAGKMTPVAGKPYLPNGKYTLTAYFTLPDLGCNEPTPLDPKTIEVNLTPTFGVELTSAKTSYNYYKENNIQKANTINKFAICELGASIIGISNAVATQISQDMPGAFTYEWFFEGNSLGKTENADMIVSGGDRNTDGKIAVDFGSKQVSCTATFEGGTTTDTKVVDITGLPYSIDTKTNTLSGWTQTGKFDKHNDYTCWAKNDQKNTTQTAYGISPLFYIPSDVNVKVSTSCFVYKGTSDTSGSIWIGASTSNSKIGNPNTPHAGAGYPGTGAEFTDITRDITLYPSVNSVCIAVDVNRKPGMFGALPVGMYSDYIDIDYR